MARWIYDERMDAFVTPEEYYHDDTPYDSDEDNCGFIFCVGIFSDDSEETDELRAMYGWDY